MKVSKLKAVLDTMSPEDDVVVSITEERERGHSGMYGIEKYNSSTQYVKSIEIKDDYIVIRGGK